MKDEHLVAARLYREWVRRTENENAERIRPQQGQQTSPQYVEIVKRRLELQKTGQK